VLKVDSCTIRVANFANIRHFRLRYCYYGKATVNIYFDIHCGATIRQIDVRVVKLKRTVFGVTS